MTDKTRDVLAGHRELVIPEGGSRYGIVIGIEKYHDTRLNLKCARADAQAMYDLMIDPDCGLFPHDNVVLLIDEEATFRRIRRELSGLRRNVGKNDTVWIYYAGHGAPEDDEFYWVPYDGNVDDLYSTGLSRNFIARVLNDIRSERLVTFLDCCHAEAMALQENRSRRVLSAGEMFKTFTGKGRVTLAASDGKQKSVELTEFGQGAFTYFLIKGLRGEADSERAGVVTLDKLWKYLEDKVSDASMRVGNRQTPKLFGQQTHKLALTLNPAETEHKRRITEYIDSCIGRGEDRLTTGEAEYCVELLVRGAQDQAERAVLSVLVPLAHGNIEISIIKYLVSLARSPAGRDAEKRVNEIGKDILLSKAKSRFHLLEVESEEVQSRGQADNLKAAWADYMSTYASTDYRLTEAREKVDYFTNWQPKPKHGMIEKYDLGRGVKLEMVYLDGGVFQMGSPDSEEGHLDDEEPVHDVELAGFSISKYQVTQEQYEAIMELNPSAFKGAGNPVEKVSWEEAVEFCHRLSRMTERQFRLPTEAEWEYACRAGSRARYCFGDSVSNLKDYAWFKDYSEGKAHPVGQLKPNDWGLYDMHGNVWEWCSDWFAEDYYQHSPRKNPKGPNGASIRVVRGGDWGGDARRCRSASRGYYWLVFRNYDLGFRVVAGQ